MASFDFNHRKSVSGKIFAATLLLTIYCIGSIEFEGIHQALHEKEHNETLEKDPCHRSVFHQDKDACKHATHINEAKKCLLCHLIFNSDEWIDTENVSPEFTFYTIKECSYFYAPVLPLHFTHSNRGPPVLG